jgi:ABC-type polysaccharide transport system permease subunit
VFSTQDGVLNVILLRLGLVSRPTDVLINSDFAWLNQTIIGIYKSAGFNAIIYIAAIAGVDPELYDAASVDGANRLGKVWHITVPGLVPTYVVLLVLSLGNLLSAGGFEQYYVFANPFTIEKLEVIDTYTYKVGILQSNYSYATAMGLMKSVASVILVFTSNFILKRLTGRAIF